MKKTVKKPSSGKPKKPKVKHFFSNLFKTGNAFAGRRNYGGDFEGRTDAG